MKETVIYLHGQGGSAKEADHYKKLFKSCTVVGYDYKCQTPREAAQELPAYFKQKKNECDRLTLVANSIGAFFAMSSLNGGLVDRAFFISPVINMEKLILNMMRAEGITEQQLVRLSEITTKSGQKLSISYLLYVREHPIFWRVPTCILYGENDRLTSLEDITEFAKSNNFALTVMPDGEHWFHTDGQMKFLDGWITAAV